MAFVIPRNGVGLCDCGDRIIVLDIDRDRYLELKPELATLVRSGAKGSDLGPSQTDALMQSGLFGAAAGPCPWDCAAITAAERSIVGTEHPYVFGVRFAFRYVVSAAWLAFFHLTVGRCTLRALVDIANAPARAADVSNEAHAAKLGMWLSAFCRAALLFPRASRCLPDALALQRLVTRYAVRSKIVFGVQTDPFQAHCWVQLDGTVLGQSLETVAGFRAILLLPMNTMP
ncbi:lasso peptide biosynthesis B2 protein [Novosphingobium resinovorum]|uniref:lasso peptide biosynthesis B2 protein n=1 Tax=Novosphingobium TaxID=165696 RepID=UPI001B3C5E37|nr:MULTISPECIES: lasso peptide biosynthesis B2 protein [Novosphingobium]MBF7013712.1 lasso peptide biosynthesis B2 protein [Novosphingobium sp. HR1a]WJM25854.1 lasso peptide biosynthesis B2 protein [Novosphingobium resinovorum]